VHLPDPVYAVTLPANRPFTGLYALFQPVGEKVFPTFEDHLLVRRQLGADFEVALCAFVPFDEEPLRLWDNPRNLRQVVVYQRFYVAFSLDGGSTFQTLSQNQLQVVGCNKGRWSEVGILEASILGEQLLLKTCAGHWYVTEGRPDRDVPTVTWEIPPTGDAPPVRGEAAMPPLEPGGDPDSPDEALLRTDGTHLWARSQTHEAFAPVSLLPLTRNIENGKVDFFGGSGSRAFF